MKRSPRAFCATVFPLEERALQAVLTPLPALPASTSATVMGRSPSSPSEALSQEVSQQSRVATVILSRYIPTGQHSVPGLQVQVTTDPSSPYVGVNVGAVNQTVTFAPGQRVAVLNVPIIAGAPNPGEVDVNLTITPINPSSSQDLNTSLPAVDTLRILASDTSIPPTILATNGTPQGIELIFNKPMDPVQASDVKNYVVYSQKARGSSFGWPLLPVKGWTVTKSLPLKSAEYNAATNTVTLIPWHPFTYGTGLVVTQGRPAHAAAGTSAVHGIVDLEGHHIAQVTTSRTFSANVAKGYTLISPAP